MSNQKNPRNFPDTIVLRANCCNDIPRWIRPGSTTKSEERSNAHTKNGKGISISMMGEMDYDFDPIQNTITVQRVINTDEHKWYEYGMPGFIITCNTCGHVTFHAYYHSKWIIVGSNIGYRKDIDLLWYNIPGDKRTWRNLFSVSFYCQQDNYSVNLQVDCLDGIPDRLLDVFHDVNDYSLNGVPTKIISNFWDIYLDSTSRRSFEQNFIFWNSQYANVLRRSLIKVEKDRARTSERENIANQKCRTLAEAGVKAATIINEMKNTINSPNLQRARTTLEKARKETGLNPIEYPVKKQDKKKVATA